MADYSARLTRETPGYFIFLLDQSYSMSESFKGTDQELSQALADMINNWLDEMITKATEDSGRVKNWFDVSVVGYRTDQNGEPVVGSAFLGNLEGRKRVPLSDIAENILETQTGVMKWYNAQTGDLEETEVEKPVWIRPVAEFGTPMCNALHDAYYLAEEWIKEGNHNNQCYPPVVINITDAELNDVDADPREYAESLKSLATQDGDVLLFNCQITPQRQDAVFCPSSLEQLPNDEFAKRMFEMSSHLTEHMVQVASEDFPDLTTASTGMVYNGDNTSMVKMFNMGTLQPGLGLR